MSYEVKAIETEYNGYKFRSRLEARWAVFFDAVGIKYEYEPEGFEFTLYNRVTGKPERNRYLPDFYFPDIQLYGEVKPCRLGFNRELEKVMFCCSFELLKRGVIVLGNIPNPENGNAVFRYPCIYFHPMDLLPLYRRVAITPGSIDTGDVCMDSSDTDILAVDLVFDGKEKYWTPKLASVEPYEYVDQEILFDAYRCARQARFEFGETPVNN